MWIEQGKDERKYHRFLSEGTSAKSKPSVCLTVHVIGELLSVAVDVSDSVGLDADVGLHQSVFLQKILHAQQVFPIILREQQHLQGKKQGPKVKTSSNE